MSRHMLSTGAHIGIFTETRIYDSDKHTMVIHTFLEYGILAISHNTTPIKKQYTMIEEEQNNGP